MLLSYAAMYILNYYFHWVGITFIIKTLVTVVNHGIDRFIDNIKVLKFFFIFINKYINH